MGLSATAVIPGSMLSRGGAGGTMSGQPSMMSGGGGKAFQKGSYQNSLNRSDINFKNASIQAAA